MDDLIAALTILSRHMDPKERNPTHCEHDVFSVQGAAGPDSMPAEDVEELKRLGFLWGDGDMGEDCWFSFRFGSC